MGMKGRMILLALVLTMTAAAAAAPSMVLSTAQVVEVVQPGYELYQPTVLCSGTLRMASLREVYLSTPVIPMEVRVRPGDYVTAGQTLAVMDDEGSRQVAQVYRPSANLPKEQAGELPEEYLALAQTFGVSGEALSSILEQYGLAQEDEGSVQRELTSAGEGDIPSEIIAPTSGMVTQVGMQEGVLFSPTATAFTIGENRGYVVQINIAEDDLPQIEVGTPVRVTGNGLGQSSYSGYVNCIYPVAQKQLAGGSMATVVQAEVTITDGDEGLIPGLSVEAELILDEPREMLTLPYEAIGQDEENREYVHVLGQGGLEKRYIVTGQEMASQVQVVDGVSLSDIVVIGQDKNLSEGPILLKDRE